jgi:hypothetical protein
LGDTYYLGRMYDTFVASEGNERCTTQSRVENRSSGGPEQVRHLSRALSVLRVVSWVAASVCVAMIVVYSFTQSMGAWLSWMTGISLLVYGLVFAGTFFVAPLLH